jgi:hypothetical protein
MPTFKVVFFLQPQGRPLEIAVRVVKKSDLIDAVEGLLGGDQKSCVSNCDLGVLYSTGGEQKNVMATAMRERFSRNLPLNLQVSGRCILVGDNNEGESVSLAAVNIKSIMDLHKELTGGGKPKRRTGSKIGGPPKRSKRAFDFFASDFQALRRLELSEKGEPAEFVVIAKECRVQWELTTASDRVKFNDLATKAKVEYEKVFAEYRELNPLPPKRVRNGYNFYCKLTNNGPGSRMKPDRPWKDMDEKEKKPFNVQAKNDQVRYATDLAKYKIWCETNDKDFVSLTKKKVRNPKTYQAGEKRKSMMVEPVSQDAAKKIKAEDPK